MTQSPSFMFPLFINIKSSRPNSSYNIITHVQTETHEIGRRRRQEKIQRLPTNFQSRRPIQLVSLHLGPLGHTLRKSHLPREDPPKQLVPNFPTQNLLQD